MGSALFELDDDIATGVELRSRAVPAARLEGSLTDRLHRFLLASREMTLLHTADLEAAVDAILARAGEHVVKDRKFLRVRAAKCARLRRVSGR